MRADFGVSAILVLTIAVAADVGGQGPSGHPNLAGTWTLDTYLSDSPEQVAHELQFDTGLSRDPALFGTDADTGRGGTRRGGIGRGGFGGDRDRSAPTGEPRDHLSAEDRARLKELTDAVQYAPPTFTIAQTETAITVTTSSGDARTFHLTGKPEKEALGAGTVERTATWEGPQLVVRYRVGNAGTLVYTYFIVPTTKQLLIRVNFERGPRERGPFDVKLVYDRSPT